MDAVSIRSNKYVESQLTARKVGDISLLPKEIRREIRKEAQRIANEDVFGAGFKTLKDGTPIEQGNGSPGNQTRQSIDAYKKYCDPTNPKAATPDPNYVDNLKRMEKELAESNARRQAERIAADDDD